MGTRQNWTYQHRLQGVEPNLEVDKHLANEEEAAETALRASDGHLRLLATQVARLRKVRDLVEQQLIEKRRQLYVEEAILGHCKDTLQGLDARSRPVSHGASKRLAPPRGQLPRRRLSSSQAP